MTLVAAFTSHGSQVLVGDVLISRQMPTGEIERVGLERKLVRLRPSIAVGYSGGTLAARALIKGLNSRLGSAPTFDELVAELREEGKDLGRQSVSLAGWIIDARGEATAFEWDSERPDELQAKTRAVIGSGQRTFHNHYPDDVDYEIRIDGVTREEAAVRSALFMIGNLIVMDLGRKLFETHLGFGITYDLLIRAGEQFEFVQPIVYLAQRAFLSENLRVQDIRRDAFMVHRMDGEHSLLRIKTRADDRCEIVRPLIQPRGEAQADLNRITYLKEPAVFDGRYCVVVTEFIDVENRKWHPTTGVMPRDYRQWKASTQDGVDLDMKELLNRCAQGIAKDEVDSWQENLRRRRTRAQSNTPPER